jgi:peptidoglycan endopeptidase LytF
MQKYYIAFALFVNLSAAKAVTLRDSIGVENLNGKKLILHQVVAKDTYYSIARRYNVNYKEVMTYNDSKYLSLGVVIKVPTALPFAGQPVAAKNPAAAISNVLPAAAVTDDPVMIEHAVQRKENLNMLAEKYGTTVNEIKRVNNLRTINLQIGQVLKIPAKAGLETEQPAETAAQAGSAPNPVTPAATVTPAAVATSAPVKTTPPVQAPVQTQVQSQYKKQNQPVPVKQITAPKTEPFVVHTVGSNETMYSIASKYNLTMDQLKAKNNLTTNSLYVGQKLLISGQYPLSNEAADTGGTAESDTTDATIKNPSLRLPPSRYGLSQVDEKGMAIWITDQDLDSSKMLVLHRTAPVGTIMQVTNPMSKRVTYAKVVGKFTENESTKDVIIVMTKAVADALGALDKRFLCNLTYSGQANEQ